MKLSERYMETLLFPHFLCKSKITSPKEFLKNQKRSLPTSDALKRDGLLLCYNPSCLDATLRCNLMIIALLEEENGRWSQMKCSPDYIINMAPVVNYMYVEEKNVQGKRTRLSWDQIMEKVTAYGSDMPLSKMSTNYDFLSKYFFSPFIKFGSI